MQKKCTHCDVKSETTIAQVPIVAAECEAVRQHSIIKRLISVVILLVALLFGSNLAWIVYESQFETIVETYEIEQDTEVGNNNCIIKGGEICNGTSKD